MFEALLVQGAACQPGIAAGAALQGSVPCMVRHNVCIDAMWCRCGSMKPGARPRALPIARFAKSRGGKKGKQDQQGDSERTDVQGLATAVMPLIMLAALAGISVQVTRQADRLSADMDKHAINMTFKFQSLESKMDSKFQSLESKMDSKFQSLESKLESLQARFEFDARLSRLEGRGAKE